MDLHGLIRINAPRLYFEYTIIVIIACGGEPLCRQPASENTFHRGQSMKAFGQLVLTAAICGAVGFPMAVLAEDVAATGLITSTSVSSTVSANDIGDGAEMWALHIKLPPGHRVESGPYIGKWVGVSMVLGGASRSLANPPPGSCVLFDATGRQDPSGVTLTSKPGDGYACVYSPPAAYWEEAVGPEDYVYAQLSVGVGHPDDPHTGPDYERAGGWVEAAGLEAPSFKAVAAELRAAGAMTATIRQVVLSPGSRLVVADHWPVLRKVTSGEVTWGVLDSDADPATTPERTDRAFTFVWIPWSSARQIVLINETDEPVQFVEWSVAPAPGTR
jgi:hypothetical protein